MIDFDVIVDEPFRAILLHSPGRKPWVCCLIHLLSPKGEALPRRKTNDRVIVPLLRSSILLLVRVYPGFHIGLCPHSTLGYAGVSCLKALIISLNFDALALTYKLGKCNKYDVLVSVSTRKHFSECAYLNL